VDRLGPGALRDRHDAGHIQIRPRRLARLDHKRLVGVANVGRVALLLAINCDGGDAEFAAGAHHADGDLPPVGHEHFVEHAAP
jgi:hypothetical protein